MIVALPAAVIALVAASLLTKAPDPRTLEAAGVD